jgi:uncharacterized protein YndB with AHSA1/START domain
MTAPNNPQPAACPSSSSNTSAVVIRRTIAATADELFDAWLEPESLAQWMRPGTIPHSTAVVDARVGGAFEVVMHRPDGPLRHYGEYRVIERNRKLVFTWHSNATHHAATLVTVEFNKRDDSTEIVLTHERLPDHEAGLNHTAGWTRALELLEQLLGQS